MEYNCKENIIFYLCCVIMSCVPSGPSATVQWKSACLPTPPVGSGLPQKNIKNAHSAQFYCTTMENPSNPNFPLKPLFLFKFRITSEAEPVQLTHA